ncbi:hypothetical protein GP486_007197 [Trichoglossum hirsutum]|uniref:C2H2-type domain-containing protein n=1 Tax=Trichoglossum hirsutum TaxID=265104 RepID=A0A9P8IG78_9PEZI|nr:hypothetical protein GP486_007197 [Trichoglossum hirsutum]
MTFPHSSSANANGYRHHLSPSPVAAAPPFLDDLYDGNGTEYAGHISHPPSDSGFPLVADQRLRDTISAPTNRTMSAHNGSNGDRHHPGNSSPSTYISLGQGLNPNQPQIYYLAGGAHTSNISPGHYMQSTPAASSRHSHSPASVSVYNKTTPSTVAVGETGEGYPDISKHTTPSFDDDLLGDDVDLSPAMDDAEFQEPRGDTDIEVQMFRTEIFTSESSPPRPKDSSKLNGSPYLSGPLNMRTPSPPPRDETLSRLSAGPSPFTSVMSTPNKGKPRTVLQIPIGELAFPGGHNNSDGGAEGLSQPIVDAMSASAHQRSPVVKVEHFSGDDSFPAGPTQRRGLGKRSRTTDPSHLAPQHDEPESSEDEMVDDSSHPRPGSAQGLSTARATDGSWLPSAKTGQTGLNPEMREQLKDTLVPNLKDQEMNRQIAERNQEVVNWLHRSQSTSGVVGMPPSPSARGLRRSKPGRRRARSMGDFPGSHADLLVVPTDDEGAIPGPGVLINEDSEDDGEDYSSEVVDHEGSSTLDTSPPASVRTNDALEETQRELSMATIADPEEPLPHQFCRARPWRDTPPFRLAGQPDSRCQPLNSNAAMMLFNQVADNYDSASRVATWGTRRRLSETDADFQGPRALLKRLSFGKDKDKDKKKSDQRGNFLDMDVKKFIPRRSGSNSRRRPDKEQTHKRLEHTDSAVGGTASVPPARSSSFGKPKLNTGGAMAAMTSQIAAIGGGAGSMSATAIAPVGTWAHAKQFVKRNRSRSDSGRKSSLSILMTQYGGPPVPTLASPPPRTENAKIFSSLDNRDEDDDEAEDELIDDKGITMDLKIRQDPITPTFAGFQAHVRQLNPRLSPPLVDRISHEQVRRYKKLIEFGTKHSNAVKNEKCGSGAFCFALGGEAKILPPRPSGRDSEGAYIGFQISASHSEEESGLGEGAVAAAQFPAGVPLPPVKRLPAEFECPLCFKVKKFQKPSDWTKHVHEDVQPFTCTFPNCSEPKSFKRKADWVRHENERHRQLEWWTCNLPDCSHTCYRKDNFVQHLVREHKKPEPKVKATKAAMKVNTAGKGRGNIGPGGTTSRWQAENGMVDADPHQEEINKVWQLVEDCHYDTDKQPREEPCRFCGNICSSWKKLTVHLARHMEQISLPVLSLVDQKKVMAGGPTVSSGEQQEPIQDTAPIVPHSWGGTPVVVPFAGRGSVSPLGLPDPSFPPFEGQSPYYAANSGAPVSNVSNYIPQGPSHYAGQSPVPDPMVTTYADHASNGFAATTLPHYQEVHGRQQFSPSEGAYTNLSPNHSYAGYEHISGQTLGLPVGGYSSPDIPVSYGGQGQNIYSPTIEQDHPYAQMAPDYDDTRIGGLSFIPAESEPSPTYIHQQQQQQQQQQPPQNFYKHQ